MKIPFVCFISLGLFACSHVPENPIPRAQDVNLDRFMGDWYVVANIPTFIEKGAHNALESYRMNDDGSIATTFTFRKDSFEGELASYHPTGFVSEQDNALWGMQFIWPIKAEYIIAYVSDDYQHTIIARNARDYLWIMAREPQVDEATLNELIQFCGDMGYDTSKIQRVPQRWDDEAAQTPEQESNS